MKRSRFLALAGAGAVTALGMAHRPAMAAWPVVPYTGPSPLIAWNQALMTAIKAALNPPTVAARSISMVYEAVYNAWAAYGNVAAFTLLGMRSPGLGVRPQAEWTTVNKAIATGYAAYGVLLDLYPAQKAVFDATLAQTLAGLPTGTQQRAAIQLGQAAAVVLLQSRQGDSSNQLGGYADTSGYMPVNGPDTIVDPTRWQPLRVTSLVNGESVPSVQQFVTPHWGQVRPFALPSGFAFRPVLKDRAPSKEEMDQLIALSAGLTDATKAQVDFFANNPGSVTPPGQWTTFAEIVSASDGNSLDQDVVMFFVLGQAMLDASIACWEAKVFYDSVRPFTAIRWFYRGQTISSWAGPGLGTQSIPGETWHPYQRLSVPSPAFPEFCSGHSTFSAAAAAVIAAVRGSDSIALSFTFPKFDPVSGTGGVPFDPTVPAKPVVLRWNSLSAAADAAGLSRRLGGIHFERGDLSGRALGKRVAQAVLAKCLGLVRVPLRDN